MDHALCITHCFKDEPNEPDSCLHRACFFVGKLNFEHISIREYGDREKETEKKRERGFLVLESIEVTHNFK